MGRHVELICVTADNNNKVYSMVENSDGTFTAKWGRVGASMDTKVYPAREWDKKYMEKLKKGYSDVTSLKRVVTETAGEFAAVADRAVAALMRQLQAYAKGAVAEGYMVGANQVTEQQVEEAQRQLDALTRFTGMALNDGTLAEIDAALLRLYSVIPRRMSNVKNHLMGRIDSYRGIDAGSEVAQKLSRLAAGEQALLDVMRQQVALVEARATGASNIAEALGIEVRRCADPGTIAMVDKICAEGDIRSTGARVAAVYDVSSPRHDAAMAGAASAAFDGRKMLLWHGSRNENWLNILKTGLLIRPSGVVTTGSMFGNGIYFAAKARKSMGYTSLDGSYWARGGDRRSYMALYDVLVGRQHVVESSESGMSLEKIKRLGCDSLWAKAGKSLYNDEFIVYHPSQCAIRHLVEFEK